uniref:P-type Cu(+) transporter n=1 Tax=Globisporangium ultimum (strain ATCC 200006 / CBS 805.95 / DAOM BR144) TaxID=431595 RepID=K3WT85_GLOUD
MDAKRASGASCSRSGHPRAFSLLPGDLNRLVAEIMTHDGEGSARHQDAVATRSPLERLGGVHGLATLLRVQLHAGLTESANSIAAGDIVARQDWFGVNYVAPKPPTSILRMMFATAFQDTTNFTLVVVATVSIVLGVSVSADPEKDWMEGACVLAAVFVIALVSALSDAQKEKQFQVLNAVNDNELVQVVRDGDPLEIRKWDVVVGDVVRLGVGDIIPADGIVIDARELQVDESAMTGESDFVAKRSSAATSPSTWTKNDEDQRAVVLLAGTKVMEGFGKMLVVCVGEHSQYGQMMTLIRGGGSSSSNTKARGQDTESSIKDHDIDDDELYVEIMTPTAAQTPELSPKYENEGECAATTEKESDRTPLGMKLDRLNLLLGKIGIVVALLVFVIMSARFSIETFAVDKEPWRAELLSNYLSYFLLGVTVLVVAIPEGLPLAVAIALAHSVRQMLRENNLVRHLNACETAGNATTICSDKTGTLTTNSMQVARVWVYGGDQAVTENEGHATAPDCFLSAKSMCDAASSHVKTTFCEGIAINSTAELILDPDHDLTQTTSSSNGSGNKTECALLAFVRDCGVDYRAVRSTATIGHVLTFSSEKKRMSVVVQSQQDKNKCRVYTKGAAETVLSLCSQIQNVDGSVSDLSALDSSSTSAATTTIDQFASQGYRTICLAYRDVEGHSVHAVSKWCDEDLERDLTCLSIIGIEDPVRPEVPGAVEACKRAGVVVRMVTGDNMLTACSIARQCGILSSDIKNEVQDAVLDGPTFRARVLDSRGNLVQSEFDKIWPQLRVLARSSPQDKYHLVQGLKQTQLVEQLVAVTGDGTNDAPALKKAHVGFAMGVCGTSVAKEASDIILMDDNFHSIVNAIKWGRNVYDSIAKFLQFQLTVIAVACTLACLGGIVLEQSPITAVQILWVNLFMDSFASLALATEAPSPSLLDRKPYPRSQPLLSRKMLKHIAGQAVFQFTLLTLLTFYGDAWFGIVSGRVKAESGKASPPASQHMTIVFNAFAWMQLFNELNCRKIHDERNIMDRTLWSNKLFIGGWLMQVILQVLIVEFGGELFHCVSLRWTQWLACIGMGACALPLGLLLRSLPLEQWVFLRKEN